MQGYKTITLGWTEVKSHNKINKRWTTRPTSTHLKYKKSFICLIQNIECIIRQKIANLRDPADVCISKDYINNFKHLVNESWLY